MNNTDVEILTKLDADYVSAAGSQGVEYFEKNLAEDYRCTNPDGSIIDKQTFIKMIGQRQPISDLRGSNKEVRVFGDFAIIHSRITFKKADGKDGSGRYTDDWVKRNGTWVCVSAMTTAPGWGTD
jgi:hypothetical protein